MNVPRVGRYMGLERQKVGRVRFMKGSVTQKAVRWRCDFCGRDVSNNSIQCISCQKWVHRKYSGIKVACTK